MYQQFEVEEDGLKYMQLVDYTVASHKEICIFLGIFENYETALTTTSGVIGGELEDESKQHLLTRFLNSAARTQVIACIEDPCCEYISIEVLSLLNAGHIYLIDIAAGHGAGTMSILNTICKMRHDETLTTDPLDIEIHALDISPHSLDFYEKLLNSLKSIYQKYAINVTFVKHQIDITNDDDLKHEIQAIKQLVADSPIAGVGTDPRYLLICSAISGIKNKTFMEKFSSSYQTIADSFKAKNSAFLWIEPLTKKNWLPRYWQDFIERLGINPDHDIGDEKYMVKQSYNWIDPHVYTKINTEGDYCLMKLGDS